jgi:transposase InsO family protein
VTLRSEFVALAQAGRTPMRELCRRFEVSPPTGYKWLHRAVEAERDPLADRSRRPRSSPRKTPAAVEARVLEARDAHPAWGGRKLSAWLCAKGHQGIPSPSTVTEILRRNGRLAPPEQTTHPWGRFEHPVPNQLWQMDFKGHVPLGQGQGRLHPLTVLDDHSRYCLVLQACANERATTVQEHLIAAFRRYGLPDRLLMDNGSPWGTPSTRALTRFEVWLLQLDVGICHGRPYHPQTQGKEERFHRTLKAELLQGPPYQDVPTAQRAFAAWRAVYNLERPHEACDLKPPVSRYRPSERRYPEALPTVEYGGGFLVRRLTANGELRFHGRRYWLSDALAGHDIGLRETADGVWHLYFGRFHVHTLDEQTGTRDFVAGSRVR